MKKSILFLALHFTLIGIAKPQIVVPDPSFGTNGFASFFVTIAYQSGSTFPYNILFDDEGRVVVQAIHSTYLPDIFYAVRFLPDGTVDMGFGEEGFARGNFCISDELTHDMAFSPDGSIYVVGSELWSGSQQQLGGILKWTPSGDLDLSFGPDGTRMFAFGTGPCSLNAVDVQSDLKPVVVGGAIPTTNDAISFVCRFNLDGTYDESFRQEGFVYLPA
jgi:uncharacterized delta-60 repeat protein